MKTYSVEKLESILNIDAATITIKAGRKVKQIYCTTDIYLVPKDFSEFLPIYNYISVWDIVNKRQEYLFIPDILEVQLGFKL
jgi:hypothetical protein